MKIAIDSGFFVGFFAGHARVIELWQEFSKNQHIMIVSTIVLNEIFTHCLRRGIGASAEQWLETMQALNNVQIVPVSIEIATHSARYRLGMQLSTVDSLILSTAIVSHCDLLITSDSDLNQSAIHNLIPIELLSK
jgi:predicted nucleic acid-binding protein